MQTSSQRVVDGRFADLVSGQTAGRNLVVSPYGLRQLFGMLELGAVGNTRDQMLSGLALDSDAAREKPIVLPGLSVRNGLWIDGAYRPAPTFTAAVKNDFGAELFRPDFASPATVPGIESWVGSATGGQVGSIPIPPASTFVAIDALSYKVSWLHPFRPVLTQAATFHAASGDIRANFMFQGMRMRYSEDGDAQYVFLPFDDENGMVVALPKRRLDGSTLRKALARPIVSLIDTDVDLYLPRFQIDSFVDLTGAIRRLGVTDVFGSGAGLTPLFGPGGPALSEVFQQGTIAVDERGARMSVVTAGIAELAIVRRNPVPMRVDRPFAFAIEDRRTGAVLVAGIVARP